MGSTKAAEDMVNGVDGMGSADVVMPGAMAFPEFLRMLIEEDADSRRKGRKPMLDVLAARS